MTPFQQKVIVVLASVIALLTVRITNGSWNWAVLWQTGVAGLVFSGVVWAFNKWLWSHSLLFPWLVSAPNLSGTWRGTGRETTHTKDSAATATATERVAPLNADRIVITQEFFSIQLRFSWAEGDSTDFRDAAPFSVVGNAGREIVFGAIYTYKPNDRASEQRPILLSIKASNSLGFNRNRPTSFRMEYAALDGSRHGWIDVSPGGVTTPPVGRTLLRNPFRKRKGPTPDATPEALQPKVPSPGEAI